MRATGANGGQPETRTGAARQHIAGLRQSELSGNVAVSKISVRDQGCIIHYHVQTMSVASVSLNNAEGSQSTLSFGVWNILRIRYPPSSQKGVLVRKELDCKRARLTPDSRRRRSVDS